MSEPQTIFKESSALAFDEEHWQKINYSTGCFENNFVKGKENYRNLELEKQRAYTLRNKSLLNTEKLLVDFETHFAENGGKVLWARNADDALRVEWLLGAKKHPSGGDRSGTIRASERPAEILSSAFAFHSSFKRREQRHLDFEFQVEARQLGQADG